MRKSLLLIILALSLSSAGCTTVKCAGVTFAGTLQGVIDDMVKPFHAIPEVERGFAKETMKSAEEGMSYMEPSMQKDMQVVAPIDNWIRENLW